MKVSLLNRVESESVPTVHRLRKAGRSRVEGRARGPLERLRELRALRRQRAFQHVLGKVRRARGGSDTDPKSRKLGGPHFREDRLQPLMPPRASRRAKAEGAERQVHVVEHDQDLRRRPSFPDQVAQRLPAAIHVGLRLRHRDPVPASASFPAEQGALAPPSGEAPELCREKLHRHEPGVVTRPLVFLARIAETHDDLGLVNLACLPPSLWACRLPWQTACRLPFLPCLPPPSRLPPSSRRSPRAPPRPLPLPASLPRGSSAGPPPRWRGRLRSGSSPAPPSCRSR